MGAGGPYDAGMVAVWINREGGPWPLEAPPPHATIARLDELETALDTLDALAAR